MGHKQVFAAEDFWASFLDPHMAQTTRRVLVTDERARRPRALDNISKRGERILSAGAGMQRMNVSEPSR